MRACLIAVVICLVAPRAAAAATCAPIAGTAMMTVGTESIGGELRFDVLLDDRLDGADLRVRWQARVGEPFVDTPLTNAACIATVDLPIPEDVSLVRYYVVALDDVGNVLASAGTEQEPLEQPFEHESMGYCEDADCSCAPNMFYCSQGPELEAPSQPPPPPAAQVGAIELAVTGGAAYAAGDTFATVTPSIGVRVSRWAQLAANVRIAEHPLALAAVRVRLGHGLAIAVSGGGWRTPVAGTSFLAAHALTRHLALVAEGGVLLDRHAAADLSLAAGLAFTP